MSGSEGAVATGNPSGTVVLLDGGPMWWILFASRILYFSTSAGSKTSLKATALEFSGESQFIRVKYETAAEAGVCSLEIQGLQGVALTSEGISIRPWCRRKSPTAV